MSQATSTPLQKAIRYAVLLTGLAALSFVLLIIAALYVPENYMLNSTKNSQLQERLPASDKIPADLLLVDKSEFSNDNIASNYPNRAEMLKLLEGFGRVDGVAHSYVSRDRCQEEGPRSLYVSLVSHKTADGARGYWQWLLTRDMKSAQGYQDVQIGDGGYLFWSVVDNPCPDGEKVRELEISFIRSQYLATIRVSAVSRQNQLNQLLSIGIDLAKVFDRQLQSMAAAQ